MMEKLANVHWEVALLFVVLVLGYLVVNREKRPKRKHKSGFRNFKSPAERARRRMRKLQAEERSGASLTDPVQSTKH